MVRSAREPAMTDVAKLAGVSHQTVSRVLNDHPNVREQTRMRVHAAIAELGYRPNRAARVLVTGTSHVIGVVSQSSTLYGPAATLTALAETALRHGFSVNVESVRALDHQAISDAIWFCLIALAVMLVAGLLGMLVKGLVHGVGLGWLDSALGLIFGLLRGAVLATLCIVILAAFFPDTLWLGNAQLSRYFLGSAHLTTHMTPEELTKKIQHGLLVLEQDTPNWLRPK